MYVTDHETTLAVDAAAQAAFRLAALRTHPDARPQDDAEAWANLSPAAKVSFRSHVLPVVTAALAALPERNLDPGTFVVPDTLEGL